MRSGSKLWLDLRTSENTFAQMAVTKLFYGVRRVVDEAGRALPFGSKVEGLLFAEGRYDRADTLGQNIPIYVETAAGIVNATTLKQWKPLPVELSAVTSREELKAAEGGFMRPDWTKDSAIALPAEGDGPFLWAMGLTGLAEEQLVPHESNIGA